LPTENAKQNADLRQYNPQARSPFWLLKPTSQHAYARLLPRLSWSCNVLLSSGTHRKPITLITAVLLPFLTYLLTLPRTTKNTHVNHTMKRNCCRKVFCMDQRNKLCHRCIHRL
jgi:hypothetical protein